MKDYLIKQLGGYTAKEIETVKRECAEDVEGYKTALAEVAKLSGPVTFVDSFTNFSAAITGHVIIAGRSNVVTVYSGG